MKPLDILKIKLDFFVIKIEMRGGDMLLGEQKLYKMDKELVFHGKFFIVSEVTSWTSSCKLFTNRFIK